MTRMTRKTRMSTVRDDKDDKNDEDNENDKDDGGMMMSRHSSSCPPASASLVAISLLGDCPYIFSELLCYIIASAPTPCRLIFRLLYFC